MTTPPPLATLTAADFEARMGDTFRLSIASEELAFKLTEVRVLGQAVRAGGAFSLLLMTPPGRSCGKAPIRSTIQRWDR